MNFFGHLVVASWYAAEPRVHLGAMLPDLAAMLGAPAPTSTEPHTARGIELHHRTDAVFHAAPTFRSLNTHALATLESAGLPRGAARAVAHIGTEIVLDGVLADDARVTDFAAALGVVQGEGAERELCIDWRQHPGAGRLERLCMVLSQRDIRTDSQQPERVTYRLERTLAHRPRLCIPQEKLGLVEQWVRSATPRIRSASTALLAEVRLGLTEQGYRTMLPHERG